MTTFIMQGKLSADVLKKISGERTAKAKAIVQKCGGQLVSVYATLGVSDILAITEFPGVGEAMKASIALNEELGISFTTVPALAVDEFDKLVGR